MRVLVDTSVWIAHFRKKNTRLEQLLRSSAVRLHPFVLGELACGNLHPRREVLASLQALAQVSVCTHDEVMYLLDLHCLHGSGLGWVDVHLLASARMEKCLLWSFDRPLLAACVRLGIDG